MSQAVLETASRANSTQFWQSRFPFPSIIISIFSPFDAAVVFCFRAHMGSKVSHDCLAVSRCFSLFSIDLDHEVWVKSQILIQHGDVAHQTEFLHFQYKKNKEITHHASNTLRRITKDGTKIYALRR